MKKMIFSLIWLVLVSALVVHFVLAQESDNSDQQGTTPQPGGVKSMEDRIKHLEEDIARIVEGDKWFERLRIHGLVEIEADCGRIDFDDPAADDEKSSDVDLTTVELAVDARIASHVDAHVLFKYEEDDLFVDQGYISLTGPDSFSAYLIAGRQYIPFGWFESHFITDPTTLSLGETNEGAVVIGYRLGGELFDVSVGAFNGKTEEADSNDHISNIVGRIVVAPIEGIKLGASYTSNLAAADSFSAQVQSDLNDYIAGWSVFATATLFERFTVIGEYVRASDEFEADEICAAGDGGKHRPAAWNAELGYTRALGGKETTFAVGVQGTEDSGGFLPGKRFIGSVGVGIFNKTTLALEYLHNEFENDDEADVWTTQFAIEF